jgi:hypothetical protein
MNYFSSLVPGKGLVPYPGVDFTARYPNWADSVQTNALGALKAAFSKLPVLVQLGSLRPLPGGKQLLEQTHRVWVTGYLDLGGQGREPQSGYTQEGASDSYLNYGNILLQALTALGIDKPPAVLPYPPQTQAQIGQFLALMAALGKGIGNVGGHELGHQWSVPQMDCDDPARTPCPGSGDHTIFYEYFDTPSSDFFYIGTPKQWTPSDAQCLEKRLLRGVVQCQ